MGLADIVLHTPGSSPMVLAERTFATSEKYYCQQVHANYVNFIPDQTDPSEAAPQPHAMECRSSEKMEPAKIAHHRLCLTQAEELAFRVLVQYLRQL